MCDVSDQPCAEVFVSEAIAAGHNALQIALNLWNHGYPVSEAAAGLAANDISASDDEATLLRIDDTLIDWTDPNSKQGTFDDIATW